MNRDAQGSLEVVRVRAVAPVRPVVLEVGILETSVLAAQAGVYRAVRNNAASTGTVVLTLVTRALAMRQALLRRKRQHGGVS